MVKVLEKIEHETTCDRCGSKLSYTYEDVLSEYGMHTIKCPVCDNEEIYVSDPDLREYDENGNFQLPS